MGRPRKPVVDLGGHTFPGYTKKDLQNLISNLTAEIESELQRREVINQSIAEKQGKREAAHHYLIAELRAELASIKEE
jgi:hypothetical protein